MKTLAWTLCCPDRIARACRAFRASLLCALTALALPAVAHKASDAYLQVTAREAGVQVRWDVALRDLDAAIALDVDADRALTWGEVRTALPRIEAYLLPHLRMDGCALAPVARGLEARSDGTYLALTLDAACAPPPGLPLRYTLFAQVDATHRGIARVVGRDGSVDVRVLDPAAAETLEAATPPASFVAEGVHHILTGYDHLLFLLCLLLPVATGRRGGRTAWELAGIATLFTVAHSATLALSVLGGVRLPPRVVEPAIALTIVAAAFDNVRPVFGRWRTAVTFAFGLVHGFGFAGVLQEMALPPAEFGWALLRFNVGLELGQLAVVAIAVPVLMALGTSTRWGRPATHAASVVAGALAMAWLVERAALA